MLYVKKTVIAALLLVLMPFAASAQDFSAQELARRAIERRAVEAVIWGMPAVNTDLMRQEMLSKTKGKENQVIYWGKPLDWHNQTLTPNPDAIYFMTFLNTKEVGPVVIEVPPAKGGALNANIVDIWQMPLEDAGALGADKGKGGKYLILPPGYAKKTPGGYFVLRPATFTSYALMRSNLKSHEPADVQKSVAYGKRIKVYPLSQAAKPAPTVFTDVQDVIYDSTIRYDLSFFQSLHGIIQSEPWLDRDRVMIDQLRTLGIEKGKPFEPDQRTKEALQKGIAEAKALLAARYEEFFPSFFEGSRWALPAAQEFMKATQSGYADPDQYPVDLRGLAYTYAYIGIKRLGAGQFYLMTIKDKDGNSLDGGKMYRLHVPPNVPIKQYWSATAYDRETHALIKNMDRASRASNNTDMKTNEDGSVDIYFGPSAPQDQERNWVPTDPKRGFEVMFRLYGPTKALFEKKAWMLPNIEKVSAP